MIDTLKSYLQQYDWSFETIDENTLLSGFVDAAEFVYPITISVQNEIVTMMITFQPNMENLISTNQFLLMMLRFNFAWPFVKIGLDEAFSIVLALDLHKSNIDYDTFAVGLDVLSETAQLLAEELKETIERN